MAASPVKSKWQEATALPPWLPSKGSRSVILPLRLSVANTSQVLHTWLDRNQENVFKIFSGREITKQRKGKQIQMTYIIFYFVRDGYNLISEATRIKSGQYDCLNLSWKRTRNMLNWTRRSQRPPSYPKNHTQLRNTENGGNTLPQGSANQVSPGNTHPRNIIQAERVGFRNDVWYTHVHGTTTSGEKAMDLKESKEG